MSGRRRLAEHPKVTPAALEEVAGRPATGLDEVIHHMELEGARAHP